MNVNMTLANYRNHLRNAVVGIERGFSKVLHGTHAQCYAGLWLALMIARDALDGDETALRTLREFAESNVELTGMEGYYRDRLAKLQARRDAAR